MQGQGRAEGWRQPKSPGCLTGGHLEGKEAGKTGRVGGAGLGHESRGAINQNEEVGEESCSGTCGGEGRVLSLVGIGVTVGPPGGNT